jgi:ribosomal protein L20
MRKGESKKFIEKAKGFYEDAKNDFEKRGLTLLHSIWSR